MLLFFFVTDLVEISEFINCVTHNFDSPGPLLESTLLLPDGQEAGESQCQEPNPGAWRWDTASLAQGHCSLLAESHRLNTSCKSHYTKYDELCNTQNIPCSGLALPVACDASSPYCLAVWVYLELL